MRFLLHFIALVVLEAGLLWACFLAALALPGCGGVERQICYASAEAAAWQDAERTCPADAWDECPDRERILNELREDYGRCP